jgi:hypothetical protein
MKTALLTLGFLLFVSINAASAQGLPGLGPSTIITLSPNNPKPNQLVTASLVTTVADDLVGARVRWSVDGEILTEGTDVTQASFVAGELGSETIITAQVTLLSGEIVTATAAVRPVEVVLSWEADTYAPELYPGRKLYSTGAFIRAEAHARFLNDAGERIDPQNLMYHWRRNGSALEEQSGRGRSSIFMEGPKFYGRDVLTVTVSTPDKTLVGESAVLVETSEPVLLLYAVDPLLGLLNHLSLHSGTQAPYMSLAAAPYFMSAQKSSSKNLEYQWTVNGRSVYSSAQDASRLSLSTDENKNKAVIAVSVTHKNLLLQEAKGKWNFSLSETSSFNPFFR